jgi:hypothetical protein
LIGLADLMRGLAAHIELSEGLNLPLFRLLMLQRGQLGLFELLNFSCRLIWDGLLLSLIYFLFFLILFIICLILLSVLILFKASEVHSCVTSINE